MPLELPITGALPAGSGPLPLIPAKPRGGRRRQVWALMFVALLALLIYAWIDVGGSLSQFFTGMFGSKGLFQNIVPASLPPAANQIWPGVDAALTTFAVAILSIFFGVIGSVAMLPLAARNITPSRPLYELARLIQAILRSIPELIMLLFFLIVFGFSPFAAVVALTFHGIGVKGKLFAEAVEEMDMAPVEALRAAGASRLQVFLHAVLPGVRNTLTGLTLYRLDANFRSAVTLGAVGGGGIGFLIDNELNVFQFRPVTTYIIILVVFVMAIERVSTLLRSRLT
ncbi:MAG: phosphonate ABC transporter, permease protein PhnE [Solirubrobacteraceae bacterium]|jgi:phosphonate transport system permease protein